MPPLGRLLLSASLIASGLTLGTLTLGGHLERYWTKRTVAADQKAPARPRGVKTATAQERERSAVVRFARADLQAHSPDNRRHGTRAASRGASLAGHRVGSRIAVARSAPSARKAQPRDNNKDNGKNNDLAWFWPW